MLPILLLLACRPDPGDPSYPDPSLLDSGDTGGDPDFYLGPDPYQAGEARLAFGAFYEGDASDYLIVDDVTRFYYIYSSTYTQTVDLVDRVEGYESAVIEHAGTAWWGGGLHWNSAENLSGWTTLHVSLRSGHAGFGTLELHLTGGEVEAVLDATAYGWAADDEWHHLSVPLADFGAAGADLGSVTSPFAMVGGSGEAGDELRVDNLYFSAE